MKLSRPIILLSFLLGFVMLAACSANQMITPTSGALPSNTKTPKPTRTPSPSPTSTPTLTPLPTVAWAVTAVEIQAWPTEANAASYVSWEDNSSIHVLGNYSVDALSGKTTALDISGLYPFQQA